jgi:hypothetical protein
MRHTHCLIEYGVFSYPHKEMRGWRCYRISYGGVNEAAWTEGQIWLPQHTNPQIIEDILNEEITCKNHSTRKKRRKKYLKPA